MQKAVGKEKRELTAETHNKELYAQASKVKAELKTAFSVKEKRARGKAIKEINKRLKEELNPDGDEVRGKELSVVLERLA